ncbi:MAG: hypothetical protein ABIH37_01845 [archaeon]
MKNKKSQSQIISTVLLILIVIGAVAIIIAFVIPFVKKNTPETSCLDVAGKINIENRPKYTCVGSGLVNVQVSNKGASEFISGIQIEISGGGSSSSYKIEDGKETADVNMYKVGGGGSTTLELPGDLSSVTYEITTGGSVDYIAVYPILSDRETVCDGDKVAELSPCP